MKVSPEQFARTPDRRDVIASLVAAALLFKGGGNVLAQGSPALPTLFIDVHCHLFNGCDVPAAKFVLHVVARESGFEDYATVAAFFVRLVAKFAPTAQAELTKLNDHPSLDPLPPDMQLDDATLQSYVFQTLLDLQATSSIASPQAVAQSPLVQELAQAGVATPSALFSQNQIPLNPEGAAFAYIARQYGQALPLAAIPPGGQFRSEIQGQTRTLNFSSVEVANVQAMADNMVADSAASQTAFGAYLSFAKSFLCYRATNLDRIDSALGLAKARTSSLYVPLLIDYDHWVGATDTTPLSVQTNLMGLISKRAKQNVLVNGFVAFDPLRAVAAQFEKNLITDDPFQTVRNAICNDGFIGVKVYPPMGFRATGNSELTDFGPIPNAFAKRWGLTPQDLGRQLDIALARLYVQCLHNEIPILAHCGNSQTSFEGSGLRADPSYWEDVLSKGVAYPSGSSPVDCSGLRLNLAHFGSIWCQSGAIKTKSDEYLRCTTAPVPQWPITILDMAAKYPNVYFDFADVGVLSQNASDSKALYDYVNSVLTTSAQRQVFQSKLLYGTDWMFLPVSAAKTYGNFPAGLDAFVQSLGAAEQNVFWTNSARYLGLTTNGMTTARLQEFYAGDTARLKTLAELTVSDAQVPNATALACPA